jgi:hypothetical protein
MPALKCDVTIEQGATFQREFRVTDKGKDIAGFTSFVTRAMLRTNSGALAASFTTAVTGPRTVLITLSAGQTALLPAATGFTHKFDVEAESPLGIVYRIAQGNATISAEQTKGG